MRLSQLKTALHVLSRGLAAAPKRSLTLDAPKEALPDPADEGLVLRIRRAFERMKADEPSAPSWTRPSGAWQEQLDLAYASLRDPARFHYFLANFGQWPVYTGIEEGGYAIQRFRRWWIGRRYLEDVFFRAPIRAWANFNRPLDRLALPRFGNQAGARYEGAFVSCGAPFNDLLGLQLQQLVDGIERPVLGEIGGGYGKLAYCALRDLKDFCYVDWDLPETLCTAAYYLGRCFPGKRILLYGERAFGVECLREFDLIFMPPWEISKLTDRSIDCFFNKNSLGEMTPTSVQAYIAHIARTTRGYFFHLNHDRERCPFPDGAGLLASEYPLPSDFRLIFRAPDMGHLLVQPDSRPDIFQYLWERIRAPDR